MPNSRRKHSNLGIVAMTDEGDGVRPAPQSRAKTAWEMTTLAEAVVMACEGRRAPRLAGIELDSALPLTMTVLLPAPSSSFLIMPPLESA